MPELTKYTYNIENDFTNSTMDSDTLFSEIVNSDIIIALDRIDTSDGYVEIWFKTSLSVNDVELLNIIISEHTGVPNPQTPIDVRPIVKTNENDVPLYSSEPRIGKEVIYASNNFCDKTTWYGGSNRINNEILNDDIGDGYTFNAINKYWIDLVSGRVMDDDGLVEEQKLRNPEDAHGYEVIITVDGYLKTAREPFAASGGDYEIFYEDGYVKFFEPQINKTIIASYSCANTSVFILAPLPGKILNIEAAEADFSSDVEYNDTIYYTAYGYVDIFAPELSDVNGGPIPSGTKIPLRTQKYKRYNQILREAVGAYPELQPNCAKPEQKNLSRKEFRRQSRGTQNSSVAIPFRYGTITALNYSYGLELHIGLENNIEFGGETATITMYCTSHNE